AATIEPPRARDAPYARLATGPGVDFVAKTSCGVRCRSSARHGNTPRFIKTYSSATRKGSRRAAAAALAVTAWNHRGADTFVCRFTRPAEDRDRQECLPAKHVLGSAARDGRGRNLPGHDTSARAAATAAPFAVQLIAVGVEIDLD